MKIKLLSILLFASLSLKAQTRPVRLSFTCHDEDSTSLTDFYSKVIMVDSTTFTINKNRYTFQEKTQCTLVISKFGYFEKRIPLILDKDLELKIVLAEKAIEQSGLVAKATRVDRNNAFTYTNMSGKELKVQNLGQDFTYLIGNTPSAVTTSDAGAGVGYTGIRIRGSDATRTNVTINGIPINDAESQGVYWVNMPDLASSTNSVQIQRGVGTSTNGSGSFGANISINNIENEVAPGLQMQQSYGSFNTYKSNLKFSTGKMGNFTFNGRLSKIASDGYIDRASSDLSAFQFNLNYYKNKWAINALAFGGKEKTYQSWYGTPQSRYENDKDGMLAYSDRNYLTQSQQDNLLNSGRTYNFYSYENQTDNYNQNHYQLHIGKEINPAIFIKSSFFMTTGKGYYEDFKEDAAFASYGVPDFITNKNDTITTTDLINRKWLDNVYYGNFTTLDYVGKKLTLNTGFGITGYQGKHYGNVIWAEIAVPFGNDYEYYHAKSVKNELNGFAKLSYKVNQKLNLITEIQGRRIDYSSKGDNSNLKPVDINQQYVFVNPKAGINYQLKRNQQLYGSWSVGNREPTRSDYIDHPDSTLPQPEHMDDFELGWISKGRSHFFQINGYYMNYKNQLVVTGALNDVGNLLRKSVKSSYRMGVELIATKAILSEKTVLEGNLTFSQNQIKAFEDFDKDSVVAIQRTYSNTNIAFSPNVIGYFGITDKHIRNLQFGVNVKYVGMQYIDNTSNTYSSIPAFTTLNFHFQKEIKVKNLSMLIIKGVVNNFASMNYTNNGAVYKYDSYGELVIENFYYPQSPINFLIGVEVKI